MNKINFTAKDNFPLSSDTMEMMQQMIALSANMALLGGANYILSGCTDDGNGSISAGLIVINGEILSFEAGTKKARITVRQTSKTLTAFGVEYPESYLYRTAQFSDTGEYSWADFSRIPTIGALQDQIGRFSKEPVGTVQMYMGVALPVGSKYLLCDGSFTPKSEYPELFELLSALGATTENGSSFSLPDLRGRFVAGFKSDNQDYNRIGKTGGQEKVILSVDQMPPHTHAGQFKKNGVDDTGTPNFQALVTSDSSGDAYRAESDSAGGGQEHENRPPFYTLSYIIKAK